MSESIRSLLPSADQDAPRLVLGEQPFDVAATAFRLLTTGPGPLSVDGAALGGGLPARRIALSELADFAVYTPLQRRGLVLAVFASGLAGLVVDSVLFLQLAFGGLDFLAGQIVGKLWMVLLSLPFVAWMRRRDERLGIQPA